MQQRFSASILVPVGGYDWNDSGLYYMAGFANVSAPGRPAAAQRRLLALPDCRGSDGYSCRQYDPFRDTPALFLELAESDGSEESIRAFANQHGALWDHLNGPNLLDWRRLIRELRDAVALWQAIVKADRPVLAEFVEWDKHGRLRSKSDFAKPSGRDGEVLCIDYKSLAPSYRHGDLVGPATALLDFVISTRPVWGLRIEPVRRGESLELHLYVQTLLSVVWIQFVLAVAESKRYGRCEFCGRQFEKGLVREDRTFCSDNCRVKNHQRRRKQALQLHREGKSPSAIAKAIASDVDTIRGWLKSKGE